MAYLEATPAIDTVVLSAAFFPYFDPTRRLLVRDGDALLERDPGMDIALAGLAATVRRIRAAGKRVVVVAPPPSNGFDYSHCIERRMANRNPFRALVDCDIPQAEYRASKRELLAFLPRVQVQGAVEVISLEPALCDGEACRTMLAMRWCIATRATCRARARWRSRARWTWARTSSGARASAPATAASGQPG